MEMKTYRVEVIHEISKHASTFIEASSQKEAVEKARQLEWKDFDDAAVSNQTLWRAHEKRTFLELIASIFGGK